MKVFFRKALLEIAYEKDSMKTLLSSFLKEFTHQLPNGFLSSSSDFNSLACDVFVNLHLRSWCLCVSVWIESLTYFVTKIHRHLLQLQ